MNLAGKTVLVTGAAKRVGRVIALRLADAKPHIIVHYNRSADAAEEVAEAIRAKGATATTMAASFDDAEGVRGLVNEVQSAFGGVDVLINNASIFERVPLGDITEAHWDAQHMVNVKAPFLLAQAFGPEMQRRGAGKIVNIADVSGENPWKSYIAYCASKAGLVNITRSLAKALAPQVQVNAVGPGPVLFPEESSEADRAYALRKTLLQREGSPADIAEAVWFLTVGTDYVTGALVPVDGGRHIA